MEKKGGGGDSRQKRHSKDAVRDKRTAEDKKSFKVVFEKNKNKPSPQKTNHAVSVETATATFQLFSEGSRISG